MIFVTIGALFPFDRLIRVMDDLAPQFPEEAFFAQIGEGTYEPRNMPFARLLKAKDFKDKVANCRLIVAHAGMGSVISALTIGVPIILVPRVFEKGEHTTDHQAATARWLEGRPGVQVAWTDEDIAPAIARVLSGDAAGGALPKYAPDAFVQRIKGFIEQ